MTTLYPLARILALCSMVEASIERNARIAGIQLPEGWARALSRNLVPAVLEGLEEDPIIVDEDDEVTVVEAPISMFDLVHSPKEEV